MADLLNPSVCRMVHYVSYGTPGGEYPQACRAAVVTETGESPANGIGLAVLSPAGLLFSQDVHYHEGEPLRPGETRRKLCGNRDYAGGTWHWLAREDGNG